MRFSIQREPLLKRLQQVVGVVERRHTLAVLANLLLVVDEEGVALTGTDLEVEMIARTGADELEPGAITVPARKLHDICRALPDGARIRVEQKGDRVTVSSGRSRFTLATLPASEFPVIESIELVERVRLPQAVLRRLIDRTSFAMAQQDVRFYLNGMLLELKGQTLRCVATDAHRLAMAEATLPVAVDGERAVIVPRKGVLELLGLLEDAEGEVELELARNHLRMHRDGVTFTSKLLDGRFPDYEAVVPIGADHRVQIEREALSAALQRAAILANEKYRGVRLEIDTDHIRIVAHNPEQEEATEELEAASSTSGMAIGFNVNYLQDALGALAGDRIELCLRDPQSGALVREPGEDATRHVIMPLRL